MYLIMTSYGQRFSSIIYNSWCRCSISSCLFAMFVKRLDVERWGRVQLRLCTTCDFVCPCHQFFTFFFLCSSILRSWFEAPSVIYHIFAHSNSVINPISGLRMLSTATSVRTATSLGTAILTTNNVTFNLAFPDISTHDPSSSWGRITIIGTF